MLTDLLDRKHRVPLHRQLRGRRLELDDLRAPKAGHAEGRRNVEAMHLLVEVLYRLVARGSRAKALLVHDAQTA